MNHLEPSNQNNNNKTNIFTIAKEILEDILKKHKSIFSKYFTFLSTMGSIGFLLTNILFQIYLTSNDISTDSIDSYKVIVSSILLGVLVFILVSMYVTINLGYFRILKDKKISKYWIIGVIRFLCFMGSSLIFIKFFPNIKVIYFLLFMLLFCFSTGVLIFYRSFYKRKMESTFFLSIDVLLLAYLFFNIQSLVSMKGDLALYATIIIFLIIYSLPFIIIKLNKQIKVKNFFYLSFIFNFILVFMLFSTTLSNTLVYWINMGNSYYNQIVISDEKCKFINKVFDKYECKNNRLMNIYVIWKNGKYIILQDEDKKLIPIQIKQSDKIAVSESFQKHPDKRIYIPSKKDK